MKSFVAAVIGCLIIAVASAAILSAVNTKGDEVSSSRSVRLG